MLTLNHNFPVRGIQYCATNSSGIKLTQDYRRQT